jgi:hypothetical protein
MKKILYIIIGLTLWTSCQAQKETLELNLTKDEIYNQRMVLNASMFQTIDGQQIDINMSMSGDMTYKIIDIQDAVYDMEVRYETMGMKMTLPFGEMEFSSDKNDENDILSTVLRKMINKPFFVKMTKFGKVIEVKNIESLFSDLLDEFPQIDDFQRQRMKDQLMQAYGEKAFKGSFEMCTAIFPDLPVSKGEKWTINTQLETGMSAAIETDYQLKEVTGSYCQIIGISRIETVDKDAYMELNGMPVKYNLRGTMTSDIKIDKVTGWVLSANIYQSVSGTIYIEDDSEELAGMEIKMTMINEVVISEK